MNTLRITVEGEAQAGKTTIAQFIQKCLNQVGIEATVKEEGEIAVSPAVAFDRQQALEESFQPRLKALIGREDYKVEIETVKATRIAL